MTITAYEWGSLAVGVLLPALTELVTSRLAPSGLKDLVLLLLSGLSGVALAAMSAISSHADWDWQQVLFATVSGFGVAVLTREGLLHPLKITGDDGLIQRKVPGGIKGKGSGRV